MELRDPKKIRVVVQVNLDIESSNPKLSNNKKLIKVLHKKKNQMMMSKNTKNTGDVNINIFQEGAITIPISKDK